MKRKLIALDLDGTTLNNSSIITETTASVLKKLKQEGHIVSIATGRPYRISKSFYNQLYLDTPMVNFNGAICHNPHRPNQETLFRKTLEIDLAMDLLAKQADFGVNWMCVEGRNSLYASHADLPVSAYFPEATLAQLLTEKSILEEKPAAVTLFVDKENQEAIRKNILNHYGDELVSVRSWGGSMPCLEVVAAGVQKAAGVEAIANHYGIAQADIIAFGDEDNDLEMIEYAGHGVAMKNAIASVKKIADDITESTNEEDGVAEYLKHFFS